MAANVVKTTKSAPTKHEIIADKEDGLIAPTSVATGSGYIVITDTDFRDSPDENRKENAKLLIIKPDATRKYYDLYNGHPTQIIYVKHGENGKNSFFTFITARSKTFAKDGKLNTPAYSSINIIGVSTMQDEVIALSSISDGNNLSNIVASKESVFIGSNSKAYVSKFSFDNIKPFMGFDTMTFKTPNKSSMFIPAVLNERYLFVADFINDAIILLDQTYVSPYELDEYTTQLVDKPATRKGPIAMVYDDPTKMLYVLNKLSGSIDIIEITLPKDKK